MPVLHAWWSTRWVLRSLQRRYPLFPFAPLVLESGVFFLPAPTRWRVTTPRHARAIHRSGDGQEGGGRFWMPCSKWNPLLTMARQCLLAAAAFSAASMAIVKSVVAAVTGGGHFGDAAEPDISATQTTLLTTVASDVGTPEQEALS